MLLRFYGSLLYSFIMVIGNLYRNKGGKYLEHSHSDSIITLLLLLQQSLMSCHNAAVCGSGK